MKTLTTSQAAQLLGKDPRSLARWARQLGVTPLRRQRIGRSTVTIWSVAELTAATRREAS